MILIRQLALGAYIAHIYANGRESDRPHYWFITRWDCEPTHAENILEHGMGDDYRDCRRQAALALELYEPE